MSKQALEILSKLSTSSMSFKILCYLTFVGRPCKPREVARFLRSNPASVRARLSELNEKDLVDVDSRGYYGSKVLPYHIITRFLMDHEGRKH